MSYRIKGWEKFQHFKDRRPPWIKLYRDLLDDPDWHDLAPADAKVLVELWLIASEDETKAGILPDGRRLAFRLRITVQKLDQHISALSHWLVQDDIEAISGRYHDDAPETETETETDLCADAPTEKPGDAKKPMDSYRNWTEARLASEVAAANSAGILTADQAAAFVDYWGEPGPTGRLRVHGEKTWETARRMRTWARNNFGGQSKGRKAEYVPPAIEGVM